MQDLVKQLMKAIGDKEVWKNAKGCYMLEIAHFGDIELPLIRNFWIDFDRPRIKIQTKGLEINNTRALNETAGWSIDSSGVKVWENEKVANFQSFWTSIPTRIFHLLAKNDSSLSYELDENRIEFYIDGKFVIWIALDDNGDPIACGRSNNPRKTHFLGKMTNYGNVRLWKEATEPGGEWNVVLVDYQLLNDMTKIQYSTPALKN